MWLTGRSSVRLICHGAIRQSPFLHIYDSQASFDHLLERLSFRMFFAKLFYDFLSSVDRFCLQFNCSFVHRLLFTYLSIHSLHIYSHYLLSLLIPFNCSPSFLLLMALAKYGSSSLSQLRPPEINPPFCQMPCWRFSRPWLWSAVGSVWPPPSAKRRSSTYSPQDQFPNFISLLKPLWPNSVVDVEITFDIHFGLNIRPIGNN